MRVRRHHAWGAVLIVLFALPVLRPDGIDALERPVGSFLGWFGRVPALNPNLWGGADEAPAGDADHPWVQALRVENAALREQIAERAQNRKDLAAFVVALQEAGIERPPRALFARVLRTADAGGARRSILIDRGEEDGLVVGAGVASGRVFLGRVAKVFRRTALVRLLTDGQSRLEVALRTDENERLTGYVRGEGRPADEGDLSIEHVKLAEDQGRLQAGEPVVTSNADARVPAGLLVGTITEVRDENLDGMPAVRFRPALDLSRSTQVLVLTGEGAPTVPDAR